MFPNFARRKSRKGAILNEGRFLAPTRGMVTEKPADQLRPDEGLFLFNCVARVSGVEPRGGIIDLNVSGSLGFPDSGGVIHEYNGAAGIELFADTPSGIESCFSGATVQADAKADGNPYISTQFSNPAGAKYIYFVRNGQTPWLYNGTTWQGVTAVSAPVAITGVTTTNFVFVMPFKQRLWFIENNSQNLWYLASGSIGGAATAFPIGPLLSKGGYPLLLTTWAGPQGDGLDDYFLILTTEGELIVYQGTDPASAATFALVGVFYVGKPFRTSRNAAVKLGADTYILTTSGVYSVGQILSGKGIFRKNALTFPIQTLFDNFVSAVTDNTVKLQYSALEGLLLIHGYCPNIRSGWITLVYCFDSGGWSMWGNLSSRSGFIDYAEAVSGSYRKSTMCGIVTGFAGIHQLHSVYDRSWSEPSDIYYNALQFRVVIVGSPQAQGRLTGKALKMYRPKFQVGPPWQAVDQQAATISFGFMPDFGYPNMSGQSNLSTQLGTGQNYIENSSYETGSFSYLVNTDLENVAIPSLISGLQARSLYAVDWNPTLAKVGSSIIPVVYMQVLPGDGTISSLPAWLYMGCDFLYEDGEAGQ